MIKIFLAGDHRLVIEGLLLRLQEESDLPCAGASTNGNEVVEH